MDSRRKVYQISTSGLELLTLEVNRLKHWCNGSNFSIFDMSLWAWIPILLFLILAFVYGIGFISALKKYKAKMKDQLQ